MDDGILASTGPRQVPSTLSKDQLRMKRSQAEAVEIDVPQVRKRSKHEAKVADDDNVPQYILKRHYQKYGYPDVKIILRDCEFPAHKIVLCSQSPVIKAMLNGRFKAFNSVSDFDPAFTYQFQESVTGEILLQEHQPHLIERMIEFMYRSDYSDLEPLKKDNTQSVSTNLHIDMCILADYFGVPPLLDLAKEKHTQAMHRIQHTAKAGKLFLDSIEYIYQKAPDHLSSVRDLAVDLALEHSSIFNEKAATRARFESICANTPDFLHGILQDWFETKAEREASKSFLSMQGDESMAFEPSTWGPEPTEFDYSSFFRSCELP
ncbi:hypothetical protein P7C71_g376, partial [Lecanoromycetidae sp. Uapishka_2]